MGEARKVYIIDDSDLSEFVGLIFEIKNKEEDYKKAVKILKELKRKNNNKVWVLYEGRLEKDATAIKEVEIERV